MHCIPHKRNDSRKCVLTGSKRLGFFSFFFFFLVRWKYYLPALTIYICTILISLLRTRRSFNKYVICVNECLRWWVVFNTISCHLNYRFLLCIDDIPWRGRQLRVWGHDGDSDHPRHVPLPGLSWHLVPRYTGVKCTSEDCEQERGAALICSVCGQSRMWAKLQAPVYDILPSTTAVFSYAIGSRKLSANEFFCWCSNSSKFVTNRYDDELMLNVLRCHLTYLGQVVTNAEARFNKSHIRKVYACFSCNLPPALLAEWPGSFTCYCGNTGVERIPK